MEQRMDEEGMEMGTTSETSRSTASTSSSSGGSVPDTGDDSVPDEDDDSDAADDEPADEGAPEEVTLEEAKEMFDTSSHSDFMSDCMSAGPGPQVAIGKCQSFASELGLQPSGGDGNGSGSSNGGDGSDDNGADGDIDVGEELDAGNLREIAKDDGTEQIWLLVEANDDMSQKWMDTFEEQIQDGLVKSADTKMDIEAQEIVQDAEVGDIPALVVEHEGDYYVAE